MIIKRKDLVDLFHVLGFPEAAKWDDLRLRLRVPQIPKRFTIYQVPEPHRPIYRQCLHSFNNPNEPIDITSSPEEKKFVTRANSEWKEKNVRKDSMGSRVGSISNKVNSILLERKNDWMDEREIANAAGVTLDQARGRLYYTTQAGITIKRVRVEYQLAKSK